MRERPVSRNLILFIAGAGGAVVGIPALLLFGNPWGLIFLGIVGGVAEAATGVNPLLAAAMVYLVAVLILAAVLFLFSRVMREG